MARTAQVNTQLGSRLSTDEYFLRMAELAAERGTCARRKVGCVLVDRHNHVLSTGYNGVCRGATHCIDSPCPGADAPSGHRLHLCEAIHAEENALIQCRSVNDIWTVYTTASPCVLCMRRLVGTGMKRVVFRQVYPHSMSESMAINRQIEWVHLP